MKINKTVDAFHATTNELLQRRGQDANNADVYEQFYNYVVGVAKPQNDLGNMSRPISPLEAVTAAIIRKFQNGLS